jgi:hypothetical protein
MSASRARSLWSKAFFFGSRVGARPSFLRDSTGPACSGRDRAERAEWESGRPCAAQPTIVQQSDTSASIVTNPPSVGNGAPYS